MTHYYKLLCGYALEQGWTEIDWDDDYFQFLMFCIEKEDK